MLLKELLEDYRQLNQQMQMQNMQLMQQAQGISAAAHNYHASRQQLQSLLGV